MLNKAAMDSDDLDFTGMRGLHDSRHERHDGHPGPVALIFLIVSFFAKVPGGVKAAAIVLRPRRSSRSCSGISSHDVPCLAPLHAINAFGILAMAVLAGKRAGAAEPAAAPAAV